MFCNDPFPNDAMSELLICRGLENSESLKFGASGDVASEKTPFVMTPFKRRRDDNKIKILRF